MEYEIECTECGWSGSYVELLCSEEDSKSDKDSSDCMFNVCPECGAVDQFEDLDQT